MAVKVKTMNDLFVHGLQDMYFAEKQILRSLPKMAKAVGTRELKQAIDKHHDETKQHVERLENIFKSIGEKPKAVACKAIEGIISEAEDQLQDISNDAVGEAAVIASAQAVEHYEISRYGTLLAWAQELGHTEAVDILKSTLDEEKKTDKLLTQLAEQKINKAAA